VEETGHVARIGKGVRTVHFCAKTYKKETTLKIYNWTEW